MWDWRRALAFGCLFGLVAPIYFFVFWHWFDFWRKRRLAWFLMLGGTAVAVWGSGYILRSYVWAGRIRLPLAAVACGWMLFGVVIVFGFVADRQIGVRVRSFRPFFEHHGHIELKTTGAYGIVRHPIYAAGLGELVSVFLITGYPSVLVVALIYTIGATWFTRQEEARLVALLDDPAAYDRYRARVPALIPRVRRRREVS
jgi:protein-S-isoprenylcysteine O-methyltransferase Ste14